MNETISIIVPIYNVEPYLHRCIDSILDQTYRPLQIILIDDGSTDGCSEICDRYQKEYTEILTIHKKNEGLAAARNDGIDNAIGEWIAFIDSDDWIEPTFCEDLHAAAIKYDASIAMCKTQLVNDKGEALSHKEDSGKCIELDYEEILQGLLNQEQVRFEVWNKLWKKETLGDIRFIKGQISEDVHFDRMCFAKTTKYVFLDKTLHNYLVKRPGNTNSSYKKNRDCVFQEFDSWASELTANNMASSAKTIQFIAMRFAIIMYYDAFCHHQSSKEKARLKKIFNSYYEDFRGTSKDGRSLKLFHILPNLYCVVLNVKQRISKRGG